MAHICPKYLPKNLFKNLHAWAIGLFLIIRKLGYDVYLLHLSNHMNISYVFNVEDLLPYEGTFEPPTLPFGDHASTLIPKAPYFS